MNALAPRDRARPTDGLRWLADAYARYAHLVHAQLQALDQGDLSRLASLSAERDLLASEIDGRRAGAEPAATGGEPMLEEVRRHLREAADADRELRRRLRELRAETQTAIQDADHVADRAATVARGYAPAAPTGGRLDVSL